MTNSAATTLRRLDARLREQVCDVVNLRLALDVQMNRISNMYDDREVPLQARNRRRVRALRTQPGTAVGRFLGE